MKTLLVCCLLAVPVLAGKRIVMETTLGQTTLRTEMLLDVNRIRVNSSTMSVLVTRTGDGFETLTLDTAKRQYYTMDAKYFGQLAQFLVDMQKQLDEMAKKLPPELREQFSTAAIIKPQEVRYDDVGDDRVDGIPCIRFDQLINEVKQMETCVAKPSDLGISDEEYRIVHQFGDYQFKLLEGIRNTPLGTILDSMEMNLMMNPELRGVALRANSVQTGATGFTERLVAVENVAFTDADFSLGDALRVEPPSMKVPTLGKP